MLVLKLVVGLAILLVGAEILVRGASRVSLALGLSPLVVGLTVVAFGTSSPEFAVSIAASWKGSPEMVLGNVIGSNVFNVLFILGAAALVAPLVVEQRLVRLEVPLMIGASVLALLLGLDGGIARWEGGLLAALLVGYTAFAIIRSRRESRQVEAQYEEAFGEEREEVNLWLAGLFIAIGLAMLVGGSTWLIDSAIGIARIVGVSETIIGLTLVAAGTSLPELATSVMASIRGERDIAVGNVVGSNLFNLLGVLGLSAAISPVAVAVPEAVLTFDLPIMVAVAVACLPIFFTGHRIDRWEGGLLFGYYVLYVVALFLISTRSEQIDLLGSLVLWFVVPLTVITLGIGLVRQLKARGESASGAG